MTTTKPTSRDKVYAVLHRNPRLTAVELQRRLPDMTLQAVRCAIGVLVKEKRVKSVGKKPVKHSKSSRRVASATYSVCYKKRELLADWIEEQVVPPMEEPKVEEPKPVWNVADIKPEPQGPVTPVAEREVLALRHLSDIYKALNLMADQQEALIEVLKGTLMDLAETKEELEQERQRRNWWDKFKGLFA